MGEYKKFRVIFVNINLNAQRFLVGLYSIIWVKQKWHNLAKMVRMWPLFGNNS